MLADDFTRQPVSADHHRSALWLANIIVGIGICLPVFVYGGQLANQLSFWPLIGALVTGGVATGILMGLTAGIGAETRLSTTLLAQKVFGTAGGQAVMLAAAITSLGWWGVQTEIMAGTFVEVFSQTYDINLSKVSVTIVGGLLMITTTIIGARAIGQLSIVAVPLMLALLIWPLTQLPGGPDLDKLLAHQAAAPASFGLVVAGMLGGWMSGVVIMPDFGRFTRNFRTGFTGSFIACLVGMTFLMGLSAFLSIWLDTANFITVLPTLGLGVVTLLVIVLATWTSNDNNLYSASLPIATMTTGISRATISMGMGIIAIILCSFGIFQNFIAWFVLIGVLLAPIAACYTITFALARKRLDWETPTPCIHAIPLLAWLAGSATGLATTPKSGLGFEILTLTTAPPLDALLVATLIMAIGILRHRRTEQTVR